MHEIKRVAEESTSGSDSQEPIAATNKLSHRLSTSQLLFNASTIQRFTSPTPLLRQFFRQAS